ncbi:lipopolysaccharide biosynthesis protein [Caenimonas terrae]|uniref:Lipopolysaccharide biosynthesis protein n=1 Tax=Caenimonas terrae TaxID=696074 RepID=A0ABW0NCV2_9BURK
MPVRRNLLAGLANSVWTALLGLAVVPLYIRYLGLEAYGLIGFFATANAVLLLLDMGLAPTMTRELARTSATGEMDQSRRLLHSLAYVYWAVAVVLGITIAGASSIIANGWLKAGGLTTETLKTAVALMGLVIACRWPVSVYQAALVGMQRLTVLAAVSLVMVTLGSVGAVAILAFVSPTVEAFFVWQAAVALLHVTVMRSAAWRVIGRDSNTQFDIGQLKRIRNFSFGMSGVAMASIVLTQLDKVLLSRMLTLQDFGRYVLAGVVAAALAIVILPVFNTIFPRYTNMIARGDMHALGRSYLQETQLFCAVLLPVALTIAVFAEDLLRVWTDNPELAVSVAPIASLLVIGSALNGVMHFPYALQIAYGSVKLPLFLVSGLAVLMVPATVVLTANFGAKGGATAWLLINVIYLFSGAWLTHRRWLKGLASRWLFRCVLMPLALSAAIVLLGRYWIDSHSLWTPLVRLVAAGMVLLLSILWLAILTVKSGAWMTPFRADTGKA